MTEKEQAKLKWYEVTWTITEGLSHIKAASEEEAKKLASEHAHQADAQGPLKLEEGRIVQHEWYDPADQEPYITDVVEDESDEGPDIEAGMEGG